MKIPTIVPAKSKLQLPMGMENSPMYEIVEKTFKPKGSNVLSINYKVWIL
jgi:hypothetical protein